MKSSDGRSANRSASPGFLHIGFAFYDSPKVEELEQVFGSARDWLRYAPTCWIVRTTSTPQVWLERLQPHLGPKDHVLIARIDLSTRSGLLPKWAWDWVNKHTSHPDPQT